MTIHERSYSGQLYRPRPEIHIEGQGELVVVATPWGPRSSAKKAIQVIQDYLLSSQQDEEATSPFSRMTCLSPLANDLRIAIKLANDIIYNEDNKNEFISGIELFVMAKNDQEVVWAQIGYPYLFLDRPHRPLISIGSQLDLSTEFSRGHETLAPLPSKLLGLETSSDFAIETFRPAAQDRFILLARSGSPAALYNLPESKRSLDQISTLLSNENPELPFWLGIFDVG